MKNNYARWRKNGAPGWLLIYTLEGRGRFGQARGELQASKGSLVLIPPRICNDYGTAPEVGRWDLLWAYFFPPAGWLTLLQWPGEGRGLLHLHLSEARARSEIVRQFRDVHRLATNVRRHREMFALNALEKVLLLCDAINPRSEQSRFDPRVLRAMDHLCQNLSEPMTLALLAQRCGLSVSRLAHLFQQHAGQSPHQFLELQRMARARQLLELTREPVTAVAAAVGFPDLFHFSRRFKHHTGRSPRHYRKHRLASLD
jgi:AraC family transcriptional regulator of arabinose operon